MSRLTDIRFRADRSLHAAAGGAPASDPLAALARSRAFSRPSRLAPHRMRAALTLVLFALVAVVMLVAMAMGAQAYADLQHARVDSRELRNGSSLLLNSVRASDRADAVYVGEGPEGRALVIVERTDAGEFETRLYAYEGAVYQEYAVAGSPYTPGRATKVDDSDTFSFTYENGLLTVRTDAGYTSVALRCAESGVQANG